MLDWKITRIKDISHLCKAIKQWNKCKRSLVFFDTETSGLHIKKDKPFLIQFGFYYGDKGYVYTVDKRKNWFAFDQTILVLQQLGKVSGLCGHNVKFDIHMISNYHEDFLNDLDYIHWVDTQVYIRAAHDALTQANGGPPLGLKDYATRYITRDAKLHEQGLALERKAIAKDYNTKLKKALVAVDKKWTLKYLDDYFRDVLHSVDTLEPQAKKVYEDWLKDIPEVIKQRMTLGKVSSEDIPYSMLDKDKITEYAAYDIIYTAETYKQTKEAIDAREMWTLVEKEEETIPALVRMERCGFTINKEYVTEVTKKLADYLQQQRTRLYTLVGQEISVGQHAEIKKILVNKYELETAGTGKEDLSRVYSELKHKEPDADVTKFIALVQELRTLEKWYTTYLLRFVREMKHNDKVYTQINQVGTVSGRVSSDFQQFPKFGIKTDEGEDLFNPRDMIKTSDDIKGIAYLDYSQIELRFQAMYTILVGNPDLNLCRAYMPYECQSEDLLEAFDYNNPNHLKNAYINKWYLKEDHTKQWEPVDVHRATAREAYPDITPDMPEFKKARSDAKRVNFAKNYGAQFNRIKQMFPEYEDEDIHRIDNAYYKAFPGVKTYHNYCYNIAQTNASVSNLFGVKYYGLSGHKLINCLVQGSAAYFLKDRIVALDKYIQDNNLKSKMQMQIHDEISFEIAEGEEHHIQTFQDIMQVYPESLVPIVADLEFTTTTWGAKVDAELRGGVVYV